MSALKFACPQCQQYIECDPAYGGTEVSCPTCAASMAVPMPALASAPVASSAPALNIDHSRPELQGFDEFYRRKIAPQMAIMQDQQKAARSWQLKVGVPGIVVNALVDWWLLRTYGLTEHAGTVLGVIVILAGVTYLAAIWKLQILQKAVKGFLLPEVCRFFGFKYSEHAGSVRSANWKLRILQEAVQVYLPEVCRFFGFKCSEHAGSVRFHEFEDSGLLPRHDRKHLEDGFTGNHNGVEFDFFECRLEKEKRDSDGDSYYKQIYHGVLFRFTFPKRFNGRTLVLKDTGLVGNFLKDFKVSGQKIKLEDPRFEKQFEVWGSDQIEARYLLTPTFMERIVELAKTIDAKRIEFCFMNNLLLVSAHVTSNQFEGGDLFTDVGDKRRVEQLVNEICRLFDIVNTLQLTLKTRI